MLFFYYDYDAGNSIIGYTINGQWLSPSKAILLFEWNRRRRREPEIAMGFQKNIESAQMILD